jgi:hypothetical protein
LVEKILLKVGIIADIGVVSRHGYVSLCSPMFTKASRDGTINTPRIRRDAGVVETDGKARGVSVAASKL